LHDLYRYKNTRVLAFRQTINIDNANMAESRQTEVLCVAWIMTGAAIFTVGVKLFARAKIVRVVGWDDFFIIFSMVSLRYVSDHTRPGLD
jgi:hypothetical protein